MKPITFTVWGIAQPQGSAKAFMPKGARFPVVTSDNPKLKGWRQLVAHAAGLAAAGHGLIAAGPVQVVAAFYLPRPKSLAKKATPPHLTRPDVDKLARATGDSLTGVLYSDDAQVVKLQVQKFYAEAGEAPHVVIAVTPL